MSRRRWGYSRQAGACAGALLLAACAGVTAGLDAATGTAKTDRCQIYRGELMKLEVAAVIVGVPDRALERIETLRALVEVGCLD